MRKLENYLLSGMSQNRRAYYKHVVSQISVVQQVLLKKKTVVFTKFKS